MKLFPVLAVLGILYACPLPADPSDAPDDPSGAFDNLDGLVQSVDSVGQSLGRVVRPQTRSIWYGQSPSPDVDRDDRSGGDRDVRADRTDRDDRTDSADPSFGN